MFKHEYEVSDIQTEEFTPSQSFPDYESLLKTFSNVGAHQQVRCVHNRIIRDGLEQDLYLGNRLLQAYTNCACIDDVKSCFSGLRHRNHISWNLIIRAYARHGRFFGDTFRLFTCAMQQSGISFTKHISASILSACCFLENLFEGRLIHALIANHGFETDIVAGTALVNMYGKCDRLEDCQRTFHNLPEHNVVSWNVMIASNSKHGYLLRSLHFLRLMQLRGVMAEKVTFLNVLDALGKLGDVHEAKTVHACIVGSNLHSDVVVMTALMKMYGEVDLVNHAQRVFDQTPEQDLVCWNALISVYAQQGLGDAAMGVFKQMHLKSIRPNSVTLISILDASASQSDLIMGQTVHYLIVSTGFELDVVLGTALINMYGKCTCPEDARKVFDSMLDKNVVSWNAIMAAYVQSGNGKKASRLFDLMHHNGTTPDDISFLCSYDACALECALQKGKQTYACFLPDRNSIDVIMGSSLVNMYGKCGDMKGARVVFDKMTQRNEITFVNYLSSCANVGALYEGEWLHALIIFTGFEQDVIVNTALINLYGKCGLLQAAWTIFSKMPEKNVLSWNAMITAYAQQGQGNYAIYMIELMRKNGITPDEASFVSLLSACSHSGLFDSGCYYFMLMQTFYDISPVLDHYNCFVDMLGRAGMIDEADKLIISMSVMPNEVTWSTLLGACQNRLDVGEKAAISLFRLDPDNPVAYVTLANVYAATGWVT